MTKREFPYYSMSTEDLMALSEDDLKDLPQKELCELSYFIWAFYSEDQEMMQWRRLTLFPLIEQDDSLLPLEDGFDG